MLEFLRDWVINIVTLVIFIVFIEILVPNGKMRKVMNLVTGLILVIALINPVLKIFRKGIDFEEFSITGSNYLDQKEMAINSEILEENQIKQISNVYREKILRQLETIAKGAEGVKGAKADVIINEDYKSESFGEILKVYLVLDLEGKEEIQPVAKVEKISVGNNKNNGEELIKSNKEVDEKLKKYIEKKIQALLLTEKENVVISLEEN